MIYPSDAWLKIRENNILPETFVEISMNFEDAGAADVATVTGVNDAAFSKPGDVVGTANDPSGVCVSGAQHVAPGRLEKHSER